MARHDADINLQLGLDAEDVKATMSDLQSKFKDLSKLDFGKSLSKGFAQVLKDMKEVGSRANTVMSEIKKLETVRPTTVYANLSKELDTLLNRQNELNEKFRTANIVSMSNKHRLQLIREETAAKNEQIKKENELIRLQNETSKGRKRAEKPLIDYKQFEEYKTVLQDYRRTNMQAMNYQRALSAVSAKTDEVTAKMEAMEKAGTHVFDGVGTPQYNMYIEELRELSDELTKYINIAEYASNMPGFTPDSATSKWQSFMAVLRQTHPTLAQLGESAGTVVQTIIDNFELAASSVKQGLGNALRSLPQLASKAAVGLGRIASKGVIAGIHAIAKGAKTAAINLANMAKNLTKSVASGIISKLKSLGSAITGVGKSTGKSNNAFKMGFMTLLRYGLGIRSVYFLFRRLRKALGEGIGNLAQYSPAFNTVISNFISALTQLKNSFATAFAPIINVVAPILTTFINIVSEAVTKVGMLIAALTGQKTFIRAKAVQTDFAASLDKTSDSTDKANKAAEKYKRTLAGFDDVEILKSPDSNSGSGGSGGGGGGGGGTSPSDMFETVAMPSAFEDWAEKIKEAWANADFTELGQILGEKIATALDNIPWDTIKSYAGKFGKSFATFINGLMATDEEGNSHLAEAIGRTIAEAINTVFTFANQFITNIDPKLVGNFFADLLNSAINTIDWNLISNTLSEGINNIFSAFNTFANKFDFSNFGTNLKNAIVDTLDNLDWTTIHGSVVSVATGLANFVNGFFTPELFGSLGTTIGNALTSAVNGIRVFAFNFDANTFGKAIGTGINNFFDTFNFESTGVTFGTLLTKIGNALTTAISEVEWQDIGKNLTGFIFSIPWDDVFGTTEQLVSAVSESAGEALAGVAQGIFEGIQKAVDNYFAEHQGETGEQIALGIVKEIADYFWKVANWPVVYILNPFIEGFCKAFGISSPATNPELLEAAGFVGEGILNGIAEPFLKIADWVKEHILGPIGDALKGAKIAVEVVLEKAKEWAGDAWDLIKAGAEVIRKTVQTVLERVGNWAGEAWEAVKSGAEIVKKTVQTVLEKVGDWTGDAWEAVRSGVETVKKTVSIVKDKTFDTVKAGWEAISDKSAKLTATVSNANNSTLSTLKSAWSTVVTKAVTLTGYASNKNSNTLSTLKGAWGAIYNKTVSLIGQATNKNSKTLSTLKSAWGAVYGKTVSLIAKATNKNPKVLSTLKSAWSSISSKTVTITAKVKKAASSLWNLITGKKEKGGAFYKGAWHDIPQYASGGAPSHGTVFVAGEAGAEAVGHIGGRTEVLNQSQMASVMYNAVLNGTASLVKTIAGHMSLCTNTVITNIGTLVSLLNFTSTQIYDITNLVDKLNSGLSDIVSGKVVPTRISGGNDDLMKALNTIIQNQNNVVTRSEIQEILTDAFRRYMNIDFYLGDEQIARHANAGNLKLNRRYGTV